jgi:hypothetical protein
MSKYSSGLLAHLNYMPYPILKFYFNNSPLLYIVSMLFPAALTSLVLIILVTGCTTTIRETLPSRTATEQLLISVAVDQAVARLPFSIPTGTKIWLDSSNFTGYDTQYAISTIKEQLLKRGGWLVADKQAADLVIEVRAGALSIDRIERLLGIPSFSIPIPLAGSFKFPEIALFKKASMRGIAKFAFFSYDAKSGALYAFSGPIYGDSHYTQWRVLIDGWTSSDLMPTDALE